MNIFSSLSQGNGRISETNITSFLSYLLNSTNEFDNSFFILFFDLIDENLPNNKISNLLQSNQATLRERIIAFSNSYTVTAIPEFAVIKDSTKQIIDVFLKINRKKEETDVLYVLIENKIKTSAAKDLQVSKQYEFFVASSEYVKGLPVYSLLLTSDHGSFSPMHTSALLANPNTAWIKWTNRKDSHNSVAASLRTLLIMEQQAEIRPINPNSQFIIKSFIDYIVTEFSNAPTTERVFNLNGSEAVDNATITLGDKTYVLRRYENKMIRIFDKDFNLMDLEVLPLLRSINQQYQLGVDPKHTTGTAKNTQVFGKDIISAFNNRSTAS